MKSRTPRRTFLGQLAMGTAGLAAARRVAAAPLPGAGPATGPGTRAAGDLARRIDLTARRLTQSGVPGYTEAFVLADVTLDTRRRFWNFSGDLSGRWIEALAVLPRAGRSPADLAPLVARLLAQQRPDGRFGRTDLAFTATETGNEHMALLWGNGRLLVGLMAYWQATRDAAVLAHAHERDVAADVLAEELVGLEQVVLVVLFEDVRAGGIGERGERDRGRFDLRGHVGEADGASPLA